MTQPQIHIRCLQSLGACDTAIQHARQYDTLEECWDNWRNGSEMLWYASKVFGEFTPAMRLACADIAESVVHLCPAHETELRDVLDVVRRYALGKCTEEDLVAAADAAEARAADDSAARAAAEAAAEAAAVYSAYSAYSAATAAATAAADFADSAAYAARAAAYSARAARAARAAAKMLHADIIRRHIPNVPIREGSHNESH